MNHPLLRIENSTKQKLLEGKTAIGLFLLSGSSIIAEVCSTLPIDWLIVDMEASPVSKEDVMHIFQALNGSSVTPMVRVCSLERHHIEHALDVGAHAILVPKVENAIDAKRVVDFCRFPPEGHRGINPVRASGYFANVEQYLRVANDRTLCMVQIESAEAVAESKNIAAVPGVDIVFIGCGDLASSLGQPGVVTGEQMDRARQQVLSATLEAGKIPGIFAYSLELARQYAKEGFRFIAIGNDIKALRESITESLNFFHK
jgi:2-keto-3-deoxy-L-rhamnonate aldolase RhmA